MAKKISELIEHSIPTESDLMPIVNESTTKKITVASIISYIQSAFSKVFAPFTHNHTKSEITDLPTIPTKTSELENDSGFINSYTETDPTVPAWAKTTAKPTYTYDEITEKPTLSTVATSGSYNDLEDKPTIPSEYTLPTASADTLGGIKVGAGLSITNGVLSASGGGVADSVEWDNVQNKPSTFTPSTHTHASTEVTGLSAVATSGSYNDLGNKPTIPTTTSQLTNNSNFISSTVVTAFWTGTQAEYDALGSYNATTLYLISE